MQQAQAVAGLLRFEPAKAGLDGALGEDAVQLDQRLADRVAAQRAGQIAVLDPVTNETFSRVLSFGRQYFDGQSLGRVDAAAVLGLEPAGQAGLEGAEVDAVGRAPEPPP